MFRSLTYHYYFFPLVGQNVSKQFFLRSIITVLFSVRKSSSNSAVSRIYFIFLKGKWQMALLRLVRKSCHTNKDAFEVDDTRKQLWMLSSWNSFRCENSRFISETVAVVCPLDLYPTSGSQSQMVPNPLQCVTVSAQFLPSWLLMKLRGNVCEFYKHETALQLPSATFLFWQISTLCGLLKFTKSRLFSTKLEEGITHVVRECLGTFVRPQASNTISVWRGDLIQVFQVSDTEEWGPSTRCRNWFAAASLFGSIQIPDWRKIWSQMKNRVLKHLL